jgi:hypothetical protein
MKSLLISVVFILLSGVIYAQKDPYVYTISKDGKKSHKECLSIQVKVDQVVFIVSGTAYQVFYKVGTDSSGSAIWADGANDKIVTRQVEKDSTVVFWKTEKKAFYYRP